MAAVSFNNQRSGCYLGQSASLNIINREIILLEGEGALVPGTILARVSSGTKYAAFDPAGVDGRETAAAILFHPADATDADVKTVATVRGPATINGNMLVWPTGVSPEARTAAERDLRGRGLAILPQRSSAAS